MTRPLLLFVVVLAAALSAFSVGAANSDPATIPFAEACVGITLENPTPSDLCQQVMATRSAPAYPQIRLDTATVDSYSFYKVNESGANVFDAPGGAVTRNTGAGFNYVRAVDDTSTPGWVQIEGNGWMAQADLTYVQPSLLRGMQIDDNLAEPFAWILGNVITSPFPGAPADINTGVRKYYYNTVNIYATVELGGWSWYMVGPDQWVEQRSVARPTVAERPSDVPPSARWISVDLYEQTLVAYEGDEPVFTTVIASGLPEWATNEGLFEVWYRLPNGSMSGAAGAPDAYALQSVPWTLYFDGDISLHGTYWHDAFGFRRSHGCVNLSISDSRWIYEWAGEADGPLNEDGQLQTFVYVHSSGEYV